MTTSTITSTSEPKLIGTGESAITCYIRVYSATNSAQTKYYKQLTPDVYVASPDASNRKMYNNGSINLFWDSVFDVSFDLQKSYQKIFEIKNLTENWNGNGASRFSSELLDSIYNVVKKLSHQPNIFPTARESIQLEYENDVGDYLEFELFEGGRIKKFYCGSDGETETKDITTEMIYEAVNRFYGFKI